MTDIALIWDDDRFAGDIRVEGGRLATDEGLRTAILLSLFTDARAPEEATLPQTGEDRRGWWGNDLPVETVGKHHELGSLLWLLSREKITQATMTRARAYARDALAWLIEDGIASAIDVEVTAQEGQRLAIGVTLDRPDGPDRKRWDFTWEQSA